MLDTLKSSLPVPVETIDCACPVCSCGDWDRLLEYDSFGFAINIVECSRCGLVYTNPRPTSAYLVEFYNRKYRFFYEGVRKLNESYIRKRRLRELADSRVKRYSKYCSEGVSVLDVGCGSGMFLDAVRKQIARATTFGIEPDSVAIEYCRKVLGLDVHQGFLESYEGGGCFDAIAAFHIVEHIDDLHAFAAALRSKLHPGGLVFVETPNCLGNWHGIGMFHIAHLQTFSPETLSSLFEMNGFEVLDAAPIENELESSNLYLVARHNPQFAKEPRARVPSNSAMLKVKCANVRTTRAARVVRTWLKLGFFALGGRQP